MPHVESLTVRILGDSSSLQQELNSVAGLLDSLQQQLSATSEHVGEMGELFSGLSGATGALQGLGNQLSFLNQQVQQLSSQSIHLNVRPALGALSQLVQAAQLAAAQLAALSAISIGGPMPMPVPMLPTGGGPFPIRGYAGGGMVTGPAGVDQVSARLTAGEFVLSQDTVAALGTDQLDRWNRGLDLQPATIPDQSRRPVSSGASGSTLSAASPRPPASVRSSSTTMNQTTNQFGGIEIHVQNRSDFNDLLQDLRRQGIGSRNRWG